MIIIKDQLGYSLAKYIHVQRDGNEIQGFQFNDVHVVLGTYAKSERAAEVMNDIQRHIEVVYQEKMCRLAQDNYYNSIPNIIFTMPAK